MKRIGLEVLIEEVEALARKYLRKRKGKTGELARLQQLREDAEKARTAALAAQHEASREREEYERKGRELEREAKADAELREKRAALQPNDVVRVSRFDRTGKVVRVDAKKQTVTVSVGLGQWEVPFAEVFPEGESR